MSLGACPICCMRNENEYRAARGEGEKNLDPTFSKSFIMSDPATYTRAGTWGSNGRAFTTHDVARICEDLSVRLGCTVAPEAIHEGGLLLDGDAALDAPYKTVRFCAQFNTGTSDGRGRTLPKWTWPWVKHTVCRGAESWLDHDPRVICQNVAKATFFFKATHGAPAWTSEELDHLRGALEKVGCTCKFNKKIKGITSSAKRPRPAEAGEDDPVTKRPRTDGTS
jgi:hypothetical protein